MAVNTANEAFHVPGQLVIAPNGGITFVSTGTNGPLNISTDANGNLQVDGTISTYNNLATAGAGVPIIVAQTTTGSISSTQTNMINYTPPGAIGTYRLSITVSTTSGTNTGSLTPSFAFKSQGGATTFAPNFMQTGSATLVTTTSGASHNWTSVSLVTIDNSATAMTLTMTVSATVAAFISATLEQLA